MNTRPFRVWLSWFFLVVCCCSTRAEEPKAKPPEVPVVRPMVRQVAETADFTGRTQAVKSVDLRARVTGYLVKTNFQEGAEVKEGEVLFEINPRPYQAQVDQAVSQVALHQAALKLARVTLARNKALAETVPGSVSKQQLDQDVAAVEEAEARVAASRASLATANLNLDFTRVRADQRPDQPVLPDPRQLGDSGQDSAVHSCLPRAALRLFRHG